MCKIEEEEEEEFHGLSGIDMEKEVFLLLF